MPQEHLGLFDTPPSRRESWLGLSMVGVLAVASVAMMPGFYIYVGEVPKFVPVL